MFPVDMFERWEGELSNSSRVLQDGRRYWVKRKNGAWIAECEGKLLHEGIVYSSRQRATDACLAMAGHIKAHGMKKNGA